MCPRTRRSGLSITGENCDSAKHEKSATQSLVMKALLDLPCPGSYLTCELLSYPFSCVVVSTQVYDVRARIRQRKFDKSGSVVYASCSARYQDVRKRL